MPDLLSEGFPQRIKLGTQEHKLFGSAGIHKGVVDQNQIKESKIISIFIKRTIKKDDVLLCISLLSFTIL